MVDKRLNAMRDNGHPMYWHKPVMNGMGAPTLDYIGCAWGHYFAIETKAPGKKPTPIQEKTMHEIEAAHGDTFVVSDGEGMARFEHWVEDVAMGKPR